MARPKSEEKMHLILDATVSVIADKGVIAPPKAIAKLAGVSEGTIFRYFSTKDELLNETFLHLKKQLRNEIPAVTAVQSSEQHFAAFWSSYINWGIANINKSKVLSILTVSDRISPEVLSEANALFPELLDLCSQMQVEYTQLASDSFFVTSFFTISDLVIKFSTVAPQNTDHFKEKGLQMILLAR